MIIHLREWFHEVAQTIDRVIRIILFALLLVVMGAITMQVINRYILKLAVPLLQWLIVISLSWMTFLGSAVAYRSNEHFYLDILERQIKKPAARSVHRLVVALVEGFSIVVLIGTGWGFTMLGLVKTSPATGYSMVFTYISIIVSAFFMLLFFIERMLVDPQKEERS